MIFYYMSFCDPRLPKGKQFLGATVVEAGSPEEAHAEATRRGLNPGGEIAFVSFHVDSLEEFPRIGRGYINRFVPREEVMRDMPEDVDREPSDDEDLTEVILCAGCNAGVIQ